MYEPAFFDVVLGIVVASVIWVQWLTIKVFKDRLDRADRNIQALVKYKAEKKHAHEYDLIVGDLEMKYMGQTAKVRASFKPKHMI